MKTTSPADEMEHPYGYSDLELARYILKRPRLCYDRAQTMPDVLALLHGVAVGRYPPHGSLFLDGFNAFLIDRLKAGPFNTTSILHKAFGQEPMYDGCAAILGLLDEWQRSRM